MSGDRELDVSVARDVLKHRVVFDPERGVDWWETRDGAQRGLLSYSSDIAAAWMVVTEMRRQDRYHGFCWSVHQEIGYDEEVSEDLGWLLFEREASEVARLICRGALRAIANPSVLDLGGAVLAAVRGERS